MIKSEIIKSTSWDIVYHQIALEINNFYQKNKEASGYKLFTLLDNSKIYKKYNHWFSNIKLSTRASIEPIQVFSSFNRSKQSNIIRTEIINELSLILGLYKTWERIDFDGCPTQVAFNLKYIRSEKTQGDIWKAFHEVMSNGKMGVTKILWDEIKQWKGIQIPSFTIFLFWIDSANFLPLDKNTRQYLEQGGVLRENAIHTFEGYKRLLNNPKLKNYRKISQEAFYFVNNPNLFITKFKKKSIFKNKVITGQNFKIVGIRTLIFNRGFHKILKPNQYYPLDNSIRLDTNVDPKSTKFRRFELLNNKNETIYNLENLRINISAIVGKNGSGKSTLLDLLLMCIYNLSIELGYLDENDNKKLLGLNVEIYWHSNTLNKVVFNKEITYFKFKRVQAPQGKIYFDLNSQPEKISELKGELFYSILINYSHYALNSNDYNNDWITPLSHKNDGYVTPLVINPKRTEGNIEINTEKELLNTRLLHNLLELHDTDNPERSFRCLDKGKSLKYFSLAFNEKKQEEKEKETKELLKGNLRMINHIFDITKDIFDLPNTNKISLKHKEALKIYLTNKLFTIVKRYKTYTEKYATRFNALFKDNLPPEEAFSSLNTELPLTQFLRELLNDIKNDRSHVSIKFKQVVNYFKYPSLRNLLNNSLQSRTLIGFDEYNKVAEKIINDNPDDYFKISEFLPPPIFLLEFFLDDKSSLQKASSGEYQILGVLSSILYHLRNIDSVENDSKYNYVSIVLDEIELYFHPNLQRLFIKKLLDALSKMETELFGIHIIFSTHSPFILSDLQQEKILKLDKGQVIKPINEYNTFAANIYDLLADEFFLEHSHMGAFAQEKIEQVIMLLNYIIATNELSKVGSNYGKNKVDKYLIQKWESEVDLYKKQLSKSEYWSRKINFEINNFKSIQTELWRFIESIGEPIIQEKLEKMHNLAFPPVNPKGDKDIAEVKKTILRLLRDNNISYSELI